MRSIGFAGTAKNTGKTTTAARVMALLRENGAKVAVTSIGYDGENVDNVTGLPKPLYYLKAGDIIATASQCLKTTPSSAYKLLEEAPIQTVLGSIQIIEILQNNTYTLAGPNRRTDLEIILQKLADRYVDYTLVDGALNRIVPMICTDGIVLSTGAAYNDEIHVTALHAAGITHLFQFQKMEGAQQYKNIHLETQNGSKMSLHTSSLITEDTLAKIRPHLRQGIRQITIPGACYPELLKRLLAEKPSEHHLEELILGNPLYLIASGDPVVWKETFDQLSTQGTKIGYLETLPLLFLTVNPFYPRFIQSSHSYETAFVDAERILSAIQSSVPDIPVINVQEVENHQLLSLLN